MMNKQRVPTDPNDAVASTSVPPDRALDALMTGRLTLSGAILEWKDAHDYDSENLHFHADSIAQHFAHNLERYLYLCPPPQRILLAGELIRGLLSEWMIRELPYEPEFLLPMTKHATNSEAFNAANPALETRAVGRPRPPAPKGRSSRKSGTNSLWNGMSFLGPGKSLSLVDSAQ
jgi:hypothetical protein